jgi:hypothetical protein
MKSIGRYRAINHLWRKRETSRDYKVVSDLFWFHAVYIAGFTGVIASVLGYVLTWLKMVRENDSMFRFMVSWALCLTIEAVDGATATTSECVDFIQCSFLAPFFMPIYSTTPEGLGLFVMHVTSLIVCITANVTNFKYVREYLNIMLTWVAKTYCDYTTGKCLTTDESLTTYESSMFEFSNYKDL